MSPPIRVLLVEDHRLVAEGMHALLDRESDIQVIGVAGCVKDAVTMSIADAPDVVIMDYRLPDGTGGPAGESRREDAQPAAAATPGVRQWRRQRGCLAVGGACGRLRISTEVARL